MRPFETIRKPPVDERGRVLLFGEVKDLAKEHGLCQGGFLDALLVMLWDALFLNLCEGWTNIKKANLAADEAYELGRWWLRGMTVGAKPLFDGRRAVRVVI